MIDTVKGRTYDDLDRVLRRLGFEAKEHDNVRSYLHRESDAFITLPRLPLTDPLREYHLAAARMTADAFGLSGQDDFDALFDPEGSRHPSLPLLRT